MLFLQYLSDLTIIPTSLSLLSFWTLNTCLLDQLILSYKYPRLCLFLKFFIVCALD